MKDDIFFIHLYKICYYQVKRPNPFKGKLSVKRLIRALFPKYETRAKAKFSGAIECKKLKQMSYKDSVRVEGMLYLKTNNSSCESLYVRAADVRALNDKSLIAA